MTSNESMIANEVAKKLKKYLDIHRREQGFDLSDPYHPIRFPQSKVKVKRNNFFENDLKKLSKSTLLKHEINQMQSQKRLTEREAVARINMEREMSKHTIPHIVSPYLIRPTVGQMPFEPAKKKSPKKRVTSAGRVGRGQRINRRAPPQKITLAERERIVNLTTKLLVATETIALPQNRKQSRGSQTSSEENFPVIPAVKRIQEMRPKSAYSDPGHSTPFFNQPSKNTNRTRSAEQSRRFNEDSRRRAELELKRSDQGYTDTKKKSSHQNSSSGTNRPKTAVISSRFKPDNEPLKFNDTGSYEDDDDFYSHMSTEVTPVVTSRANWSDNSPDLSNNISTQTVTTSGTQTNKELESDEISLEYFHRSKSLSSYDTTNSHTSEDQSFIPSYENTFSSGIDLLRMKDNLYRETNEDMSTQTRKRSLEPKVVTYEIYVVTGNKLGSSTKARVKINIFGEYGNTGDRKLIKPLSSKVPFQRNQIDVFHLDCMFLGKLSNIRIGHDGTSVADGWYLDRVVVKEGLKATRAFKFQCSKWLSAKEGDGQIIRDLTLTKQVPVSETPVANQKTSTHRISSSEDGYDARSSPKKQPTQKKSSEPTKIKTQSREYFDKNEKFDSASNSHNNKPKTKVFNKTNSFNKKTRNTNNHSSSNSLDSHSSSSDSEIELEKRQVEKKKRREKRMTKDKQLVKPKANYGGLINKVELSSNLKKTSRRSSDSSRTSQASSGKNTPNSHTGSDRNTPTRNTKVVNRDTPSDNSVANTKENKASPKKTASNSSVAKKAPVKTVPEQITALSSDSISSITSSDDSDSVEKHQDHRNESDDEKVELKIKDTEKKYSETITTDDLYMAGFLAGIKANKDKEGEHEKKQKQEFEDKIKGGPTIHEACEDGDLDRVKELIDTVPELKNKPDERGWEPIHISAAFGHLDLVKWLSVSGVHMTDETPTGYTAIHLAAMNGHVNCIMILAAMGCPISSRTVDDFTPLHLAAMSGHIECLKWLLSNRAKVDVKDVNGRTPLDLAEEYSHEECIRLLKVMKSELNRKDSVMQMLRDPNALRKTSSINAANGLQLQPSKGADSGVQSNDEEWLSDTEETSDVVGRGGDDRSETQRRISVQVGRKQSSARKPSSAVHPPMQRKMSKQEIRQADELGEKKKVYEKQRRKLEVRKTSFLDSIRQDVDDGEDDFNY